MTVCFFNTMKSWGGGEQWHYSHAIMLSNKGYRVIAVVGKDSILEDRLGKAGFITIKLKTNNLSFLNFFKIVRLSVELKKNKVDAIIFNSSVDIKVGLPAALLAGIKKLIYRRGSPTRIKKTWLNQILIRYIQIIICNSEATKKAVLGKKKWINQDKIKVIYNGLEPLSFLPENRQNSDKVIIGSAGRLTHEKGHQYLIDAIAKIQTKIPFEILIAGDGKLRIWLQNYAIEKRVDQKIKFLGFVADLKTFYNAIDIFVLPSVWEGFGFAIAEAMQMYKPVIAFDTGSIPEVIDDKCNGFIVRHLDTDELAQKLTLLIESPELRVKMGKAGADKVEQKFSMESSARNLCAILESL